MWDAERSYDRWRAYGESKVANLLFTYELQRRFEASGADAIAVAAHPGWTATNLQGDAVLFRLLNPLLAMPPEQGALPTSRLRREAALSGKANASRFDRALAELQMDWRIAKVAISDANRWGYCYVYDLLPRHFPGVVEEARDITGRQARETILLLYLKTVVAVTTREVVKLFGWQPGDVDRLATRLADGGQLRRGIRIEGLPGEYLLSTA